MEAIFHQLLYIGDDAAYSKSKDKAGWSFLRACKYGDGGHQQTLGYTTLGAPDGPNKYWVRRGHRLALNMLDLDDPNFIPEEMIQQGLDFITERLEAGDKVLVACNAGQSRGPSIGLMWLRKNGDMPHAYLLSQRIYHTIYPPYMPKQGIEQFARMHWPNLGETGRV